jgi:hypothetical protein
MCEAQKQEFNIMIIQAGQNGATIIPFPNAEQRRAKRFEDQAHAVSEARYETVADYEGGWYHSDAIDADRNTKQ